MPRKRQTEKKTFSIIFLQYMRHYTWVRSLRSNSQVCKCLAVWSPVCSLIFLYLSFSTLENKDCITCPSLNLDSYSWLRICNTGVWKTQKIKHKCHFSLFSELSCRSHNRTHQGFLKGSKRPGRTFRCHMVTEASHYLSGSMTILSP